MVKKPRRRARARSRATSGRRPKKRAHRAARKTKPRSPRKPAVQAPRVPVEPAAPSADDSYQALPRLRTGPGVLVVHAWWGLNPFIRTLCDRLAREGFVVLAPDLYHGSIASTIPDAETRSSALDSERVRADLVRAVETLRRLSATKSLGVLGLSLGAFWGLWLACERPDDIAAVVAFYAARPEDYTKARAAFQCHFAADDPYATLEEQRDLEERFRTAGREAQLHTYAGTKHWFFEEDRLDAYDATAATLAWRRSLGFLRDHLKA